MRIADHLVLPTDVSTDAFIVRVTKPTRESLATYVLPRNVYTQVDDMLGVVGQRLAQGKDVGRFLHGSFGSGKSHLMQVLGAMLARNEAVYEVGDPRLRELRQKHPWLDERKILIVNVHMMDKVHSLASALYQAYNGALPSDVPELELSDHDKIFDLIDRDAERMGGMDAMIELLRRDGVLPSLQFFERNRNGGLAAQQDLAARLLTWRNHGEEPISPEELWMDPRDGFEAISRHAREHGYGAIAWFIDELIIWIRGRRRDQYMREINHLSALVDHDGNANRALPFFVSVAIQRDIAETCPQDLTEQSFREHLRFVANRFEPPILLEDTDLYEVCERRVLRRRNDEAKRVLDAEIERVMQRHRDALTTLAADVAPDQVRALYPYHPALIRALMDVTQAFSRSRTAVQVLYALLVRYLPDLEVGQFVPMGTLFDAIFTGENRTALKQNVRSPASQKLVQTAEVHDQLLPVIKELSGLSSDHPCAQDPTLGCSRCAERSDGDAASLRRCHQVDQLVKSVLLCQESHRAFFAGGRSLAQSITVQNLIRLNMADIRAVSERAGVARVSRMLETLAARSELVRITGQGGQAVVAVDTESVDVREVLDEAAQHVRHNDRFALMLQLLDEELGLRLRDSRDAALTLTWRGTKRKGRLRVCNVRTLPYAGTRNDFDPDKDAFLILVDYPFDEEPGRSRDDDVDTLQRARGRRRQYTAAWLPEHLDTSEQKALEVAAAIELVRANQRAYLDPRFKVSDVPRALQKLETFQDSQKELLRRAIRRVYFDQGMLMGMTDGIRLDLASADRRDTVTAIATRILDVRYKRHPRFPRLVRPTDLDTVMEWVVRASLTGQPVEIRPADRRLVDDVAHKLELVHPGESSVSPREDGSILRRVLEWSQDRSSFRASELRRELMAEGSVGFGLTREVADVFVYYLLQVRGYEAVAGGQGLTIEGLSALRRQDFLLRKDDVVDPPTWDTAREAARLLLNITGRRELPSSPEQAKLAREAVTAARRTRGHLDTLSRKLLKLLGWVDATAEDSARAKAVDEARARLSALLAEGSNADRMRKLAALLQGEPSERAVRTACIVEAEAEARAAGEFGGRENAVVLIRDHGTEEEKGVLTQLRNLLTDPVTTSLAREWPRWRTRADKAFRDISARLRERPPDINRPPPRPPESPPRGPGHKQASATGVSHGEVAARAQSLAQELIRELGEGCYDVVVTLERKP